MAYDYVTVALSMNNLFPGTPGGSLTFEVSDFVMDTSNGDIVLVPPVILAMKSGGQLTPQTVQFLATDSNSISVGWSWILTVDFPGRLTPIPRRSFQVRIANGAEQSFGAIMATSTIVT